MIATRIQELRKNANLTQAELAKKLFVTRAGVNAWEMGITTPSSHYLIALAQFFHVSTDYLLGIQSTCSLDVSGLTEEDVQLVHMLITHLRAKNEETLSQ